MQKERYHHLRTAQALQDCDLSFLKVRAHLGGISGLSVSQRKSGFYGAFVWAHRALTCNRPNRRPPAAGQKDDVIKIGEDHPLLMDRINMLAHKRVKKQNERINVALPPRDWLPQELFLGPNKYLPM